MFLANVADSFEQFLFWKYRMLHGGKPSSTMKCGVVVSNVLEHTRISVIRRQIY